MNIALIGPSGAGKGTHATALARRFRMRHLVAGDVLRHHLETNSPLGLSARRYMEHGELVPDELADRMITDSLAQIGKDEGVLLDGFPRTLYQANHLDALLESQGRKVDAVICFSLPDDEIVRRLDGRLVCCSCQMSFHATSRPCAKPGICDSCGGQVMRRADDTPALVLARLRNFHRTTGPVLTHYTQEKKLILFPGSGEAETVGQHLAAIFAEIEAGSVKFAELEELPVRASTPEFSATKSSSTLDLVLLGGPGSGKGTQAEYLSAELKLPHIATGDLFRQNLQRATELGKLAKTYMDRGELVPDDVTEAMVDNRLSEADADTGFILDGFPRTLAQGEALAEILGRLGRRLACVLYIEVPDDTLIARLSGRWVCRKCQAPFHDVFKRPLKPGICDHCFGELYQRDDDNPVTIRARLATFHAQTEPLIEFYKRQGLLKIVDGGGAIKDVRARSLAEVIILRAQHLAQD